MGRSAKIDPKPGRALEDKHLLSACAACLPDRERAVIVKVHVAPGDAAGVLELLFLYSPGWHSAL